MLRVHSILYLQHVWTRPSFIVEEEQQEPQIEEPLVQTQEQEVVAETTPQTEELVVDNTADEDSEQVEQVVSEEQQPVLVEEPEPIRSEAEQKRDSKMSTFSKELPLSPIAEEQGRTNDSDFRAVPPPPILANSSSITVDSSSLPPTPVSTTQPSSRSKQIKSMITKRKTIGKKIKRAFSVSSSTSTKRKSM